MNELFRTALRVAVCLLVAEGTAWGGEAAEPPLPLWPNPQKVELCDGRFDVAGATVFVPERAGEHARAAAAALARSLRVTLKLQDELAVKESGAGPERGLVLTVGKTAPDWREAAAALDALKDVPAAHAAQGYVLHITPAAALVAASEPLGLSYGALTLMQIARSAADGTRLPTVSIADWPVGRVRAAHIRTMWDYGFENYRRAALYAMDMKLGMLVWEVNNNTFPLESHPEAAPPKREMLPWTKEKLRAAVDFARDGGVEVVPLHNFSTGHWTKGGYPYVFLGDGEMYYWAAAEMIDEHLELFRPRHFHLGMDEEQRAGRHLGYPSRSVEQWRDAIARLARHLRRRGVVPMVWSDPLEDGRTPKPYKPGDAEGYYKFTATLPRDLILVPWFYWTKKPEDVLDGPGALRRQAKTGLAVITAGYGDYMTYHAHACATAVAETSNVHGIMSTWWRGPAHYQSYVRHSAGRFWNPAMSERSQNFKDGSAPITGWEVFIETGPAVSVPDALRRLADPDWMVWTRAREELVAGGLSVVPALLKAMAEANDELRERIEGCISRNARDARNTRTRGSLDDAAVLPGLAQDAADVRCIAAEVLASCTKPGGRAALLDGLRDTKKSAACARALGLVRDEAAAAGLRAVLADEKMPDDARAEAARVVGAMRVADAAPALLDVLRRTKAPSLQKAALWALALLGHRPAAEDIAALVPSADDDLRYRAAIALVMLRSERARALFEPWLAGEDRHSLELAAWALVTLMKPEEASALFAKAADVQKNAQNQRRLRSLSQIVLGKGNLDGGY